MKTLSVELDVAAYQIFLKLLSHSYMHDWNDWQELATYPPIRLTDVETEWFKHYKLTGQLELSREE